MKLKHLIVYIFWYILLIQACQKESPYVEVTENQIDVNYEGGLYEVAVKSNCQWKAASTVDWVHIAVDEDGNLMVSVNSNNETDSRKGSIVIYYDTSTLYLSVKQDSCPIIYAAPKTFFIPNEGEIITVNVESNREYAISCSADWIQEIIPVKGLDSFLHSFTVLPNDGFDERKAEIIFFDPISGEQEIISVVQQAMTLLALSQDSFYIGPESTTLTVSLTTNLEGILIIPGVSWISQVDTKSIIEEQINLSVSENSGMAERTGHVLVKDTNNGECARITVTQEPKPYIKVPDALAAFSPEGGTSWLDIKSNIEYSASCEADWLTIEKADKTGIMISLQANHSFSERETTLLISAPDYGIGRTVLVSQEGIIPLFSFTHSASVLFAPILDTSSPDAVIDWGDGARERYNNTLIHDYSDHQETHLVTITATGASEILFGNISGIIELDLSTIHQ